jgi:hypothetical protein
MTVIIRALQKINAPDPVAWSLHLLQPLNQLLGEIVF